MMNFSLVVRLLLVLSISSIFYSFTYIKDQPYVVILGVAQDGGAPHAACEKSCCIHKWNDPTLHNKVSSIGIVDPISNEVWMIDATPDFAEQLHLLTNNNSTVGIGSGQPSRLDSCEIAVNKMKKFNHNTENLVAASDAFFPFVDGIESLVQSGVKAIIQPFGSIRDKEIIKFANNTNTVLVFSKTRHFRH